MPKNTAPQPDPEADAQPAPDVPGSGDPTPPTPPPAAPLAGNRFFAWMRSLGITREPGWIGGVAAGVAARLGVDPLLVRGIAVVVAVLGGPALLLYAAGWLLLPDQNDKIHLEEVFRGRLDSPIAGIGALILLSMLPVTQGFWFAGNAFWGEPFWGESFGRALWTLALLGGIVWFVVWVARRSQRGDGVPTPVPATTDARPDTIPQPATAESAPSTVASPGVRPPAPAATASAEEFAAWRTQQAQWKAENDAFRAQRANEQRAASMAAHEQYRAERAARRAVEAAHHARTRSNPLFSFVFIGASFVVFGIVALLVGGGQITAAGLLAGLGAMLAVLAVAIIVNGARGRRPGGSQGVAAIVLTALIVAAFVPHGPNISYDADARFAPAEDATGFGANGYFVGFGDAELDLRGYYDDPRPDGVFDGGGTHVVNLAVGQGDTTVYVPQDEYVAIDVTTIVGAITTPGLASGGDTTTGRWDDRYVRYGPDDDPDWQNVNRAISVRIFSISGDVTIIRTPSTEAGTN